MTAMRLFFGVLLVLGTCWMSARGEFVPPAEGPVPFRRDRLPLDVETMTTLSRHMTALAGDAAAAGEPRTVARMTALALALDPANRQARELIEAMRRDAPPEAAGREETEKARNRSWHLLSWLESPEAGADGQALAACLGDVLAAVDPEHPRAKDHKAERGAWTDWVPEQPAPRPEPPPEPPPEPEKEPEKEPPPPGSKGPALATATVTTPLWSYDKDAARQVCRPTLVTMQAKLAEAGVPLLLTTDGGEPVARKKAGDALEKALAKRLGPLPEGLQLVLRLPRGSHEAEAEVDPALTGAAAVLLDAAIRGKAPGATVLAVVEDDGSLSLPPRFWETLRELSDQPGMRLVLPQAAAESLAGLLVLDRAAFFMKHEVLLAANADELCDLAGDTPGDAANGLAVFAEIRRVGQGKPFGSFLAHTSTQQRLNQVIAALPSHASARLLALQGSGNRPRFLARPLLARDLRTALEPLAYLEGKEVGQVNPQRLDAIHTAARALLDEMPGYIDTRDRELHRQAVAAADNLRTLARALRLNNPEKYAEIHARQTAALKSASDEAVRMISELTVAAGDAKTYKTPSPVPDGK